MNRQEIIDKWKAKKETVQKVLDIARKGEFVDEVELWSIVLKTINEFLEDMTNDNLIIPYEYERVSLTGEITYPQETVGAGNIDRMRRRLFQTIGERINNGGTYEKQIRREGYMTKEQFIIRLLKPKKEQ